MGICSAALELEKVEAQKLNDVYTYTDIENEMLKSFFPVMQADKTDLIDDSVKFENDRLAGYLHRSAGNLSQRKDFIEKNTIKKGRSSTENPVSERELIRKNIN